MKTKLLLFAFSIFSAMFFAQQHQEFREVKAHFDQQKTMVISAFKQEYQSVPSEVERSAMRRDFAEFMAKMDSVENFAYLSALIKVKNLEDLQFKNNKKILAENKDQSTDAVEQQAEYPGGINMLRQQIADLFYSGTVLSEKPQYRTLVKFIVEKDGSITSVEAEGDDLAFNKQAMVAVYLLPDRFSPAKIHGYPVRARFSVPLTLKFE